jgi:hypothetical protein
MTKEQSELDDAFQNFLTEIDNKYRDYFESTDIPEKSVKYYFATYNGARLISAQRGLRKDIYDEVVQKHKDLWGDLHTLAIS